MQTLTDSKVLDIRVPFLGKQLIPVSSVKDLGIILDSNLSFNEHVNTLTSSLISILSQILLFPVDRDTHEFFYRL